MLSAKPTIGTVLFNGFELLDVFGPLELFLLNPDLFQSVLLGERTGPVSSGQGPAAIIEQSVSETREVDILLVPGGKGSRTEINNDRLIDAIHRLSESATLVCSVCTGAALLAKTRRLDGKRATTNKAAWQWATAQGPEVNWVAQARWVEDGKYFTSSGISAGMDMALAVIRKLYGEDCSESIARKAEYQWNRDKNQDPFARLYGLA